MSNSINLRTAPIQNRKAAGAVKTLADAQLTDLAALRASIVALTAKIDVLAAKLNADAGVTDTNYAVDFASAVNPAALTTLR